MAESFGRFIWHEFVTTNPKAALDFYLPVVGWTVQRMPMEGGGTYHILEAGGRGMGGVFQVTPEEQAAGMTTGWVGYIHSPDVDAGLKRLTQLGGTVFRPAEQIANVGRFAPVGDPQGGGFILFKPQPPPGEVPEPAKGVGSVGWCELYTSDWKAAWSFYSEMFGWKKEQALEMGEMGTYQIFSAGGEPIGGMMNVTSPGETPHWDFYFRVESVDAAIERVKARGGKVLTEPVQVPGGNWVIQCRDPLGGLFSLSSAKR